MFETCHICGRGWWAAGGDMSAVGRFKSESLLSTFLAILNVRLNCIALNVECLLRSGEIVSPVFTVDREISACIHFLLVLVVLYGVAVMKR